MDSVQDKRNRCRLAQLLNAVSCLSNGRIVRRMLASGVDVNHKFRINSSGDSSEARFSTALHLAARSKGKSKSSQSSVEALLEHGADVTIKDSEGLTALHRLARDCLSEDSVECPSSPLVGLVLSGHAKSGNWANPGDAHGLAHFHVACAMGSADVVRRFLDKAVDVNQAVSRGAPLFPGFTPLHFAARFGRLPTAELLVERGADARLTDARGMSPMRVLMERKIAMLELLEARLRLEDAKCARALLAQIDDNESIVKLLLDSDAAHVARADELGMCKYHAICTLQGSAVAARHSDQITDVNARLGLHSAIWPGYTMLHFAAHCSVLTMKLLLDKGADIRARDANGLTPFDICAKWCRMDELRSIMGMVASWRDITFSNGRTKLLDCIGAMAELDRFKAFMESDAKAADIFLPSDSALWPGWTLAHLSVLFAERCAPTRRDNSAKQPRVLQSPRYAELDIVKACQDFGPLGGLRDVRGRTPLHLAFRSNKSRVVDMLLLCHRDNWDLVDDENLSHLHIACAMRKKWIIEKCLASKAELDVNVAYGGRAPLANVEPGWTPLHVAVSSSADLGIVKMLLSRGADPHRADARGLTPIHLLLVNAQSDLGLAKLLLSAADWRADVAVGHLHVASHFNNVQAVDRLLDLGSDIDAPCPLARFRNCTPLHLAMANKSMAVVEVLVRRGADVLAARPDGSTPLSTALTSIAHRKSLKSFVAVLRSNETLRGQVEASLGLTILHVVCRAGHVDAVKDLLNKGADVNAKLRDDSPFWPGWTPLHVLVAMGTEVVYQIKQLNDFKSMLRMLLERGSHLTVGNADGDTPLHLVMKKSARDTGYLSINWMLSYQKDSSLNPVNKDGLTHFHAACLANNLEAAEKFLAHGAVDVNQTIDYFAEQYAGSTPLHLALNPNSKRYFGLKAQVLIVDLLLKYKPDVRAEDVDGYTPLHVAADCVPSGLCLLEKLVDHEADMYARTIDGKTAFEMILRCKEISVKEVEFFVKRLYRVNACNPMTDRGYLSIILNESNSTLRNEILKRLMTVPDIAIADEMGRTAIHNVVSTDDVVISEHHYVDIIDKLAKLGCDVNEQDHSGMTALHLAMLFRNKEAIRALLICGVDINIVDSRSKTAFSYALEPCTRCLARCNTVHDDLLKLLAEHVHTLQLLGLCVSEQNERNKCLALDNRWIRNLELPAKLKLVDESNKDVKSILVGPRGWTLYDFLKEHGAVDDYRKLTQTDRAAIDQFFESIDYHSFRDLKYVLKVQYRQAAAKEPLIKPAIASIQTISGLPDLCVEAIAYHLRNPDLKNVTIATNTHG